MTTSNTDKAPVEAKVTASTLVTFLASAAIAILNLAVADSTLLGNLPPVVQTILLALVPTALTFLGGYAAPHTSRTTLRNTGRHDGNYGDGTLGDKRL